MESLKHYSGETDVVLAMKINSNVASDFTLDLSTMKMENEETGMGKTILSTFYHRFWIHKIRKTPQLVGTIRC